MSTIHSWEQKYAVELERNNKLLALLIVSLNTNHSLPGARVLNALDEIMSACTNPIDMNEDLLKVDHNPLRGL